MNEPVADSTDNTFAPAAPTPPAVPANRELAALIEIFRELNAAVDPSARLPVVVATAARAVGAEAGSLFLLDGDPPHLTPRVFHQRASGESQPVSAPADLLIAPGRGSAGWVVVHGQPLRIDDAATDPRFAPYTTIPGGTPPALPIRNLLSVPLRADGRVLGALDVVNRAGGFDPTHESFLSAVADELAIALRNAWLVKSLEQEKLALELIRDAGRALLSTLSVDEVLERIVSGLARLVAFDAVGIFLVGKDKTIEQTMLRGYDPENFERAQLKVGEGIVGWSIAKGKPVIVPDVSVDTRYVNSRESTRSEMVAPLIARGKVIGAFVLESDRLAAYSNEDLKRLTPFADSAAVAVEVARLHEEAVRVRRIEEDLAIARQIQLSFLPEAPPKLKGIDLAGLNVPSFDVGGDYYDFVTVAPGQLGIAIGDVAGKGVAAGLILSSFRSSMRAEIRNNYSIATIFNKVNQLLLETTEPSRFVTAIYGVLDLDRRRFTYSCAGHFPGLLVHEDGSVEELSTGGTVLGAFPRQRYDEGLIHLRAGDMLILYTDGVTEAINKDGEEFGTSRLLDMAVTVRARSAAKIAAAIERAVRSFSKRKVPGDDLTLVVLKVTA
jgi:sigma-B regulation protein RsbU (phosphoserine phosphatase)